MFGKNTYLFYTLFFTLPLICLLWGYYFPILKRKVKTVFLTTLILTTYGYFLWPLGLLWQTWAYSPEKILDIKIGLTHLEDILWWFLISFLLSSFTIIFSQKEEGGQPF